MFELAKRDIHMESKEGNIIATCNQVLLPLVLDMIERSVLERNAEVVSTQLIGFVQVCSLLVACCLLLGA